MRQSLLGLTGLSLCLLLALAGSMDAQSVGNVSTRPPDEDLYVYKPVPDIRVQRVGASQAQLSDMWRDKPVLLTMVFTRCVRGCSPFLRSLKSAVSEAGGLGADYRILVLSFDPTDTLDDLHAMAADLGVTSNAGWVFGTAASSDIQRLAEGTGFWYRRDQATEQYDHPSVVVAIDRGRVLRMLAGATVSGTQLSEVVEELRGKFVPSYVLPGQAVAFRCFEYDPTSGRYALDWGLLLLVLPSTFAALATLSVFQVASSDGPSRTTASQQIKRFGAGTSAVANGTTAGGFPEER